MLRGMMRPLIAAACWLLAAPADAARTPGGAYEVVAVRMASGVAGPLDPAAAARVRGLIGRKVFLGAPSRWIDGRSCAGARLRPTRQPVGALASDPMLSDAQVRAGPEDRRLNRGYVLDCGGRAAGSVVPILQVDARVLVAGTENGRAFLLLEAPLSRAPARAVERALRAEGLDPGPVDGVLDGPARRAIAQAAKARGAAYAFDRGVLGENLIAALLTHAPPGGSLASTPTRPTTKAPANSSQRPAPTSP